MSLGLARDSMLNLSNLVHDDEPVGVDAVVLGEIGLELEEGDAVGKQGSTLVRLPSAAELPKSSQELATAAVGAAPSDSQPADANPEEPERKDAQNSIKPYAAFAHEYSEYADYYENDPYAVSYGNYAIQGAGGEKNIFCCLFAPWTAGKDEDDSSSEDEDDSESMGENEASGGKRSVVSNVATSAAGVVTVESTCSTGQEEEKKGNDAEGMDGISRAKARPSSAADKDESTKNEEPDKSAHASDSTAVKGEKAGAESASLAAPETDDASSKKDPKKGILKHNSFGKSPSTILDIGKRPDTLKGDTRRHMFPGYVTKSNEEKKTGSVNFAPMARVVTVTSRKDLSFVQKSQIWWQRSDYDDFKKTGRIIAKAMLEGGSQIWLTSNDAWGKRQQSQQTDTNEEEDTEYERALRRYSGNQNPGDHPESETDRNKWWCKFGHSRRGLEHIASSEEGKQRQRNVNTAKKAVVQEQQRQRMNNIKDPRKLANVGLQYTSWARDLALAAGAADAEAVRSNFKSDAKCRTHYLRTGSYSSSGEVTNSSKYNFISGHIAAELLDANAHSSMQQQRSDVKERNPQSTPNASTFAETVEAIHDPSASHESMAKKAAGFHAHEDEKMDMSAVLTGMGSVTAQG